jgi:hypothetical protein
MLQRLTVKSAAWENRQASKFPGGWLLRSVLVGSLKAVLENGKNGILILFNAVLGRLNQEWSEIWNGHELNFTNDGKLLSRASRDSMWPFRLRPSLWRCVVADGIQKITW